jgi:hypothetical protein
MKKLISFGIFFSLVLFSINCNEEARIVTSNQNETDFVPLEKVSLYILEYVKITDDALNVWYEWRQTAAFECSEECYYGLIADLFITPLANRYEGNNYLQTQYYKIGYGVRAECRPYNWGGHWTVWAGSTYYLNEDYYFIKFGSSPNCPPNTYSGNYSDEISEIYLPSNSTIQVLYGAGPVGEDDK